MKVSHFNLEPTDTMRLYWTSADGVKRYADIQPNVLCVLKVTEWIDDPEERKN